MKESFMSVEIIQYQVPWYCVSSADNKQLSALLTQYGSDYFASGVAHITHSLHLIYLIPALLMFGIFFASPSLLFIFHDR